MQKPEKLFYVVFHGLIPLMEFKDRFEAIVVKMDEHKVLAGHWLTEGDLPPGELKLSGVEPGNGTLDDSKNLVVKVEGLDTAQVKKISFATIDLPKPRHVHSFCTGELKGELTGAQASGLKRYSACQVFEYVSTGEIRDIKLSGKGNFSFSPRTMTLRHGTEFSVMHIVNEPESDADGKHAKEEFNKSVKIYPGVDLQCADPLRFPEHLPVAMPHGLLHQELAPLSRRAKPIFEALTIARGAHLGPVFAGVGGNHFCGGANGK